MVVLAAPWRRGHCCSPAGHAVRGRVGEGSGPRAAGDDRSHGRPGTLGLLAAQRTLRPVSRVQLTVCPVTRAGLRCVPFRGQVRRQCGRILPYLHARPVDRVGWFLQAGHQGPHCLGWSCAGPAGCWCQPGHFDQPAWQLSRAKQTLAVARDC
eukprot:346539-Chlamydomonas_euryale.AAC.5